jgi:GNAT superfamily N-acetyltransferase
MGAIVVRPARPGDGDGMARAWLDAGRDYQAIDPARFQVPAADGLAEWFEAELRALSQDWAISLVAEVDGRVVGFLQARLHPPLPGARRQLLRDLGRTRLEVDALGVQAPWRRRGVGTAMLRAVEGWGHAQGATLVVLDTFLASPMSVPFYERRMGYQRRSVRFEKRLGERHPGPA